MLFILLPLFIQLLTSLKHLFFFLLFSLILYVNCLFVVCEMLIRKHKNNIYSVLLLAFRCLYFFFLFVSFFPSPVENMSSIRKEKAACILYLSIFERKIKKKNKLFTTRTHTCSNSFVLLCIVSFVFLVWIMYTLLQFRDHFKSAKQKKKFCGISQLTFSWMQWFYLYAYEIKYNKFLWEKYACKIRKHR